MTEPGRDPDNLVHLREVFGNVDALFSGDSLTVDGVEFVSGYKAESTADRFYIVKPLELIDRYRQLCQEHAGGNIFELGIAEGGSTALMALWADPKHLIAIDNEPSRLTALDDFIEQRSLGGRVHPFYGVDQADRDRLRSIAAEVLDGEPLDLIIDDASHLYGPTLASFEALFPYLRVGGTYLIEDWDADMAFMAAVARSMRRKAAEAGDRPDRPSAPAPSSEREPEPSEALQRTESTEPPIPVARLALRFVLACASQARVISEIAMNKSFVAVTRGPEELDPDNFSLASISPDYFNLVTPLEPG
ncbi:MAG: class I SAM-dependent methyltransferase [Acidimicrobiales bacterium]|nr:class I SAM-dependent methyltransferase [Acidimicrobiales bacterium]